MGERIPYFVLLFVFFIFIAEILLRFTTPLTTLIFYGGGLFVILTFLVLSEVKKEGIAYLSSLNLRYLLILLMGLPIIRIVELTFPFKDVLLIKIIMIYSILAIITAVNCITLRINFRDIGHNLRNLEHLKFLILLLPISLIAYFNNRVLGLFSFNLTLLPFLAIIFVSYIDVLYFRGLIQNLSSKVIGNKRALFLTTIFIIVLQIQSEILQILSVLVSSLIIGLAYFRTRSVIISFILQTTLNMITYTL